MAADKSVQPVSGTCTISGAPVTGYEIHMGQIEGMDVKRPVLLLGDHPEGAQSSDRSVGGSHVHGLFASDAFRAAWIRRFHPAHVQSLNYEASIEQALDDLARELETAIDCDRLLADAQPPGWSLSTP